MGQMDTVHAQTYQNSKSIIFLQERKQLRLFSSGLTQIVEEIFKYLPVPVRWGGEIDTRNTARTS
jgi:hypothetical protein